MSRNGIVKKMDSRVKKIEISYKTIVFTVLFLVALWFFYQIREILLALFISLILMGALNPLVSRLEKGKIPRWLAIFLIYFFVLGLVVGAFSFIIPPLIDQTSNFSQLVVSLPEKLSFLGLSPDKLKSQLQEISGLPTQIVKVIASIFSNVIAIFVILVITFYLLLEHQRLDDYLFFLFGSKGKERASRVVFNLERKLGSWVRAQLFLMIFVGALSYLGFRLLDLNFALPLAIFAGILEIVPNIGPTLAAVPAIAVGFLTSPLMGLLTFAWTFIVQQIENNFLVPKIMQKSVGANPLVTILSLAIGFKLAGVMGAVLAIPVYLVVETIISEFFSSRKSEVK